MGLKTYTSAFYLYNILNSNKKIDTEFMFNFFKNGKNYIIWGGKIWKHTLRKEEKNHQKIKS